VNSAFTEFHSTAPPASVTAVFFEVTCADGEMWGNCPRYAPARESSVSHMTYTPLESATAVLDHPVVPPGDDERVVGFGVMGFPFASGHCLALRHFPATTFSPGYRSVWHRSPEGVWTFYATTPGQLSCARYFSAATPQDAVQCAVDIAWVNPWTLFVTIDGLLEWTVDIRATATTRMVSALGRALPERAWTDRTALRVIGSTAGAVLRAGTVRLTGTAPNGQRFMIAPREVWLATGRATLGGVDLGSSGPLTEQARLGDFHVPQRGIFVVGSGHFDVYDPACHQAAERTRPLPGTGA